MNRQLQQLLKFVYLRLWRLTYVFIYPQDDVCDAQSVKPLLFKVANSHYKFSPITFGIWYAKDDFGNVHTGYTTTLSIKYWLSTVSV